MFLTLTMVCWAVSVVCQTRLATWLVSRGQPSRAIPESTWRLNEQRHRRGLLSLKPSDDRGVRGQSMIAGRVHLRLGEGVRMPAACETAALISRPRTTAYLSEIPPLTCGSTICGTSPLSTLLAAASGQIVKHNSS